MEQVRSEFKTLRVADKVPYLRKVISSLTDNTALQNVYPSAQHMTVATDSIEQLESEVNQLNVDLSEKNEALRKARARAGKLSKMQAKSGSLIADGDGEVLRSSGLTVYDTSVHGKRAIPKPKPRPKPMNKVVGLGVTGIDEGGLVELTWEKETDATSYVIQYSEADDGSKPWETFDYSVKTTFKDHVKIVRDPEEPLNRPLYYFRVAALGKLGAGRWSDVAWKHLL